MRAAGPFCRSEKSHQDCWKKNPDRYRFYRYNSGHDQYLQKVCGKDVAMNTVKSDMSDTYGKPDERGVTKGANTLHYKVTQENGTESAFKMNTGTSTNLAFMLILSPANRCSILLTSAIRALDGFQDIKTHPLPRHIEHASC